MPFLNIMSKAIALNSPPPFFPIPFLFWEKLKQIKNSEVLPKTGMLEQFSGGSMTNVTRSNCRCAVRNGCRVVVSSVAWTCPTVVISDLLPQWSFRTCPHSGHFGPAPQWSFRTCPHSGHFGPAPTVVISVLPPSVVISDLPPTVVISDLPPIVVISDLPHSGHFGPAPHSGHFGPAPHSGHFGPAPQWSFRTCDNNSNFQTAGLRMVRGRLNTRARLRTRSDVLEFIAFSARCGCVVERMGDILVNTNIRFCFVILSAISI